MYICMYIYINNVYNWDDDPVLSDKIYVCFIYLEMIFFIFSWNWDDPKAYNMSQNQTGAVLVARVIAGIL